MFSSFLLGLPLLLLVAASPVAVVISMGAWRLKNLRNYRFCVLAAILAMLPVHVGFPIGLPLGIYILSLLRRPDVKAAFDE